MAIDFGRMARGVATGYLSAKIANTEANDKMNGEIHKAAGVNFYTNRLPEFYKTEKMIEKEFKQIASAYNIDFANAAAEQGWITGDGNAFNNISNILKSKKIDKDFFKGRKFSTYEERKAERLEGIQNEERVITGLTTGSSKIGPMTVKSQLEGITKGATTTDIETVPPGTPADGSVRAAQEEGMPAPIQIQSTQEKVAGSDTLFTSKAPSVEGTQARYKHIANAVNELGGYTENIVWGEGGNLNLNLFGERRNEAGAHIALANRLTITNPQEYNQYNAAPAAKQWLDAVTVQPFENLATELKLKYKTGNTKLNATFGTPGSTLDVSTALKSGATINDTIISALDRIPSGPSGEASEAVLARFIENIPDELTITTADGKTENYKQHMSNLMGMRNSIFWTNFKN